eukprot:CAMPEP_0182556716 /NCGR_PEP_ID=MMETSP1324-20130603/886_1 /TAXON_ID=236786 /ORGANISM="Florenciella sp., Strain RCC1587" /LENGTH=135 /DNA_ID=CAMNT_0024768653 /DNA_START=92 /DNA_END=499 /DNA_ORIENTATION=-
MRAVYFILAATLALVRADDYQDWECPGMPCFIVNYFETRPYDDIKQTCTSISSMTPCNNMMNGVPFDAVDNDGNVLGTHNVPSEGLPCHDVDFLCKEKTCTQGSLADCNAACEALNLLDVYASTCTGYCTANCEA